MQTKLISCKVCGATIAKSAKICPHCGAKNKKPLYKKPWYWIIIALGLFSFISLATSSEQPAEVKTPQIEITDIAASLSGKRLEIVSDAQLITGDYGIQTISGVLKNISGRKITYAQITFALFDSEGNQIGTAVANINNLTEDATWKYSAIPLITESFETFELTSIDAY